MNLQNRYKLAVIVKYNNVNHFIFLVTTSRLNFEKKINEAPI